MMYILSMTAAQPLGPRGEVEMTVTDARGQLPELLDTYVRNGDVVPAEVAERLDALEDAYWSRRAAEVLARDEPAVPWDQAVAELEAGDKSGGR
jgi:hypothetical protein